jgi:hypothetical protein
VLENKVQKTTKVKPGLNVPSKKFQKLKPPPGEKIPSTTSLLLAQGRLPLGDDGINRNRFTRRIELLFSESKHASINTPPTTFHGFETGSKNTRPGVHPGRFLYLLVIATKFIIF